MSFLSYLFWPNPGNALYGSPKALALLVLCGACVLISFGVRMWRRKCADPMVRKLTRSWASALLWFGASGLILVIARVEYIQFLAMRFWWLVWLVCLLLYFVFQYRIVRQRYYRVIPQDRTEDPREKYLPKVRGK